jgi:cellulose synthase (UDP-forming)
MATSFNLHRQGYKSYYYHHVLVEGEGPMNMPGYYKQQMRWAYGTITILKKVIVSLITDPMSLTLGQWEEYILATTWYFVGWAYFLLMICPIAFLLFNIHPFLVTDMSAYVLSYIPYFIFSFLQFFLPMYMRGYSAREISLGSIMTFITFPVFMKAAVYALLGRKIPFVVTPKMSEGRTELKYFFPHIAMMILLSLAIFVGFIEIIHQSTVALFLNILWCSFFLILIQTFRYFRENSDEVSMYYNDIFEARIKN